MPKVYIELDYEVVQQAIKAKVPAAVEDILRRYDLQRIVEAAITSNEQSEPDPHSEVSYRSSFWSVISQPSSAKQHFEATLRIAINSALEIEITKWLKDNPEMLRAAVEKKLPEALNRIELTIETKNDDDD